MNRRSFLGARPLIVLTLLLSLLIVFAPAGCSKGGDQPGGPSSRPAAQKAKPVPFSQSETSKLLKVHFIDVGQADAILAQLPNGDNMLIDAGNNADGPMVLDYLRKQGVNKIDYLVGTHPHEDHIGGMDQVIREIKVGKVYLPPSSHTTPTYEQVLKALKEKGLKAVAARAGLTLVESGRLKVTSVAPVTQTAEDINDLSAVLKIVHANTVFLLAGDTGAESEALMVASGIPLKADVLKVGHHGSRTSSTTKFLKKVMPRWAVVSVGAGNRYGHPHKQTLDRLRGVGATIYRTDHLGTIVATSDGTSIKWNK